MALKWQNGALISGMVFIFLTGAVEISHAVLSMDEVQVIFEQEKGYLWQEATSEERKVFIRDIQGREEYNQGEFKEKKKEVEAGVNLVEMSAGLQGREEKAPYEVRASYEAETGIEWSNATEEEQEDYWKKYDKNEKKRKKEEQLYLKKLEKEELKERKEFFRKKLELEKLEKKREREKELKLKKERKKQEENKKRLEREKKELQRLLKKSRQKR
ncbi:MAG: hypothetical protein JW847_00340 [Candidatus Omnitrophica bacterium]|nr:hypothetical protein [Candidatus Omnitrophota bacterium]